MRTDDGTSATKPLSSLGGRPGPDAHRSRSAISSGRGYPLDELLGRARTLGTTLSDPEVEVGNVLFHAAGRHLDTEQVVRILRDGGREPCTRLVGRALASLAERGIVQRIPVADGRVFYDIELAPHLHVYDPRTHSLRDATASAVLTLS